MKKIIFSRHALEQMALRDISEAIVTGILENPGNLITEQDKKIYQSIVIFGEEKYLVRIFVNNKKEPNVIITVYRTSKINKYYEG
jgi:hypothetical protein